MGFINCPKTEDDCRVKTIIKQVVKYYQENGWVMEKKGAEVCDVVQRLHAKFATHDAKESHPPTRKLHPSLGTSPEQCNFMDTEEKLYEYLLQNKTRHPAVVDPATRKADNDKEEHHEAEPKSDTWVTVEEGVRRVVGPKPTRRAAPGRHAIGGSKEDLKQIENEDSNKSATILGRVTFRPMPVLLNIA